MSAAQATDAAEPALVAQGVSKHFGSLHAVHDVAISVPAGQRRGIIGPNGAGKSSFFNVLGGQYPATDGKILLFGEDITKLPPHRRAARGLTRTFQLTTLFSDLSVLDNLVIALQGLDRGKFNLFWPMSRKKHLYARAEQLLVETNLVDERHKRVETLSFGRQRVVEFAVALAGNPRVLMLDEPTAGLSERERESLVRLLENLDERITLLLIEHDMQVCFRLVEYLTVMHRGGVLADGPAEDIRTNEDVQGIYLGERW